MSVLTFKGGVHPLGKKELSKTKNIIYYFLHLSNDWILENVKC